MKKQNKISSSFIAFLAVLILFVSVASGSVSQNEHVNQIAQKTTKSPKKSDTDKQHYFSKASIEAVFSPIIPSFEAECVIFWQPDFKFSTKEVFPKTIKFIGRNLYFEILFEHLTAPNAP